MGAPAAQVIQEVFQDNWRHKEIQYIVWRSYKSQGVFDDFSWFVENFRKNRIFLLFVWNPTSIIALNWDFGFKKRYTNSLVERLVVHSSFPMSWDFGYRRNLNEQEIEGCLVDGQARKCSISGIERRWKLESTGKFSCKSFHRFLINSVIDPIFASAKCIWNSKAPT